MVDEIDLTKQSGGCGANSPAVTLMKYWLESGGNREVKVLATPGVQSDQVEMWATAMGEQGVKILKKDNENNMMVYIIHLP
ncbi:hypothetical protein GWK48_09355 [Metallosphaera tengchongensis]|uniref:Sulfurtransferase TusA family protein n=1 Tax=Metallosphaera tengchongensis TaxID=1532350 RepID=A0A6N0NWG6_9CREN|nr:hypothetical protein [Metallosphaera tengchongensis]QKR00557.1 hypothetical protein GWK48_09355 [Metallosphaera tengchongensis]